jgi:hypothetical protein
MSSCSIKTTFKKKEKEGFTTFPHKTSLKNFLYNCKCSYKKIPSTQTNMLIVIQRNGLEETQGHKNS